MEAFICDKQVNVGSLDNLAVDSDLEEYHIVGNFSEIVFYSSSDV